MSAAERLLLLVLLVPAFGDEPNLEQQVRLQRGADPLARQSFQFGKRQREIAKKQKKEEKRLRKAEKQHAEVEETPEATAVEPAASEAPEVEPAQTP